MITPAQCRAARGLLRWSQEDLAARSEVGLSTIKKFEAEMTAAPHKSTLKVLCQTFQAAGIQFTDDNGIGVKLKRQGPTVA